ncbi:cardiolipin synthase [Tropicimonas sp. TH_r6]|uniref:cardiolipin synthase n=1 Tax=Tropicimonas sp. TH_r6 TaxID=3082085 RepID=UPI002953C283|nr:cardiolipin synthase [Tropicimonas sp. TH_r6]MDV7143854.1 cardiolipin synthase [Tropicimonas sp. TH_r6]
MYYILVLALVFLEIVAIVFAIRAVRSARTPQGSVAWVVFLIAAPYLAVPAYLFLGHSRVNTYIVGRRESEEVIQGLERFAQLHEARGDDDAVGYPGFETIGEVPVVSGNNMDLLVDGPETFEAIFSALDAAEAYVLVQSYIINDDELGRAFHARLIACAKRGVTVRLLYDAVGCVKLPAAYLDTLRAAGVQVMNAHALRGPKTRFQINFRNHRKTIVVDGTLGFTGGFNIGDEYMGRDPKFGDWRDTHCRLHGPVVSQLQLVFAEDWHWATEEVLLEGMNWDAGRADANMDALIMATGPADEQETGSLYFCAAITAARKRLWIASPYFVPENDILTNLKLAAMRGVDVRIMVPEVIDHTIPWLAAFAYFDELMEAGVQIWRYDSGFMHQKVLVVDEAIASVGTTNLDNRSCRLNFEATALFFDSRAARDLAAMLEADFERCIRLEKPLREQPFKIRNGAPIARLFAPLL